MPTDDEILDAALRVFERAGFRAATTRKIAEEAGINEVTLFRRFGHKEYILMAAMRRHGAHRVAFQLPEDPQDPEAELSAWARGHLEHLIQIRALLRSSICELELHPEACGSAHEGPIRVARELSGWLARLRERGMVEGEWEPESAAWMLMGSLFSEAVGRDMPGRPALSPAEIARRYTSLFLRAIGLRSTP